MDALTERRLTFQKSYSLEHRTERTHRSLIDDAKLETEANEAFVLREKRESLSSASISEYDDDGIIQTMATNGVNMPDDLHVIQKFYPKMFTLVFSLSGNVGALSRTIKAFEKTKVRLDHIESRHVEKLHSKGGEKSNNGDLEFFVESRAMPAQIATLTRFLRESKLVQKLEIIDEREIEEPEQWFPMHISELDNCTHLITKFQPELDTDHPGFTDKEYRKRRHEISNIAFSYQWGQPIPRVEYTQAEVKTWRTVYGQMKALLHSHACSEYQDILNILEKEGVYGNEFIPQLEDVSNFMKKRTGLILRPVAGLLSARDFLASLAFRVFQCTQYVRHPSKPEHSPEPDVIHELIGHVPLLCEPTFAQFSQELGLASLGASDLEIERLATLYWFTVEFGLCHSAKCGGEVRAIGAGLLSSFGELKHALSGTPELRHFIPEETAVQEYQDVTYQPIYFVAESFEDMKSKFRDYVLKNINRKHEIRYNPYTQYVEVFDTTDKIEEEIARLNGEVMLFKFCLDRIKNN